MKISVTRILLVLQVFQVCAFASNSVVNLSHYDLMRVDFERMKSEGIVGVIHEATYPRFDRDSYYGSRQDAATRAGLLWGAYHFGDATDPVRQADHFLTMVASQWHGQNLRPDGVLLVLDFEKNDHYPGGSNTPSGRRFWPCQCEATVVRKWSACRTGSVASPKWYAWSKPARVAASCRLP